MGVGVSLRIPLLLGLTIFLHFFLSNHPQSRANKVYYMISNKEIIAIGKRIKIIRNARKITQEKLAEMSELTLAHISNIENGHSKMVNAQYSNARF